MNHSSMLQFVDLFISFKVSYQFQGVRNNWKTSIARFYVVERISHGNSILQIAVQTQRSINAI